MMTKTLTLLGIETSCDDTAAAVVTGGKHILSSIVSSQNDIHRKYGGVVPELASRKHIEAINIVIGEALSQAGISLDKVDVVSVTNRPGLIGSLLVGVGAAKAISYARKIPLVAVNHLKAHLFSNLLAHPEMDGDFIGLIVSGGHSSIYQVDPEFNIIQLGHTLDDAAGEAFDKIARYLNLGYPGGPVIDKLSKKGDENFIDFPRPMWDSGDFNFSFSGLKTALIYLTKKNKDLVTAKNIPSLAASFQQAIVDVLVEKTVRAAKEKQIGQIAVSGGVAANARLRQDFEKRCKKEKLKLYIPPLSLCMDNAAMVGCLGYYEYLKGNINGLDLDVYSRSEV
ncbi:MAG: tRNA (adenosine(37)-N6)-threonylcarbamoyltransferase complex transferase subunit TsaD [Actinomycetota bacterium]|nr:tRNA (adenosine(37)-N6)-threonylcarbamoyltransferase complex transferase subunit TsaD [Actinomycetota bacterium]